MGLAVTSGGDRLDIHKPKPFHSVKEFFSEIVVIVTGIVIALGGEQMVEHVHWAHAVEAERHALLADVQDHLKSVAIRAAQQKCVDDRLVELGLVFSRHKAGQPLGLAGAVGRPQSNGGGKEVWQVAVAGQAVSRMPIEERTALADAFSNFDNLYLREWDVDAVWINLSALDHPDLLEADDWPRLRQAYTQVLADEDRIKILTNFVLTKKSMGLTVPSVDLDQELVLNNGKALCRPLLAK